MTSTAPSTPTTRTSRKDGMQHMIDATVRLLHERGADQITVRDVAEAAGHHHRFVQAWFGGKVGLFRAAFEQMITDRAAQVGDQPVGVFGPEERLIVSLMNWLVAAEPGSLDGPRPTPILDRSVAFYREHFGLDESSARLFALRAIAVAVAGSLFPGPMGIKPGELDRMVALELELAQLYAAQHRG
jgi:AcrR family transcriptional regulator